MQAASWTYQDVGLLTEICLSACVWERSEYSWFHDINEDELVKSIDCIGFGFVWNLWPDSPLSPRFDKGIIPDADEYVPAKHAVQFEESVAPEQACSQCVHGMRNILGEISRRPDSNKGLVCKGCQLNLSWDLSEVVTILKGWGWLNRLVGWLQNKYLVQTNMFQPSKKCSLEGQLPLPVTPNTLSFYMGTPQCSEGQHFQMHWLDLRLDCRGAHLLELQIHYSQQWSWWNTPNFEIDFSS